MDREALAYAAGLFEGEGSVSLSKGRPGVKSRVKLALEMTDKEPLEQFVAAVGFGHLLGPYERNVPNRKPRYILSYDTFERVQAIIAMLWPWLSPRRREQAKVALAGHTARSTLGRWPASAYQDDIVKALNATS